MKTKLLSSLLLVCSCAFAQAVTHIKDTLYQAPGKLAQGRIVFSNPAFITAGGQQIAAGSQTVYIVNGIVDFYAAPTIGASPAASYSATYYLSSGWTANETWDVPVSATPITLNGIRSASSFRVDLGNVMAGNRTIGDCIVVASGSGGARILDTQPCTAGGTPLTSKGQIFSFGTSIAALNPGSDGTVLFADSTQALGLRWKTPVSGDVEGWLGFTPQTHSANLDSWSALTPGTAATHAATDFDAAGSAAAAQTAAQTYTSSLSGATATTVAKKIGESLSVMDFGADPTCLSAGGPDSASAIQAAIESSDTNNALNGLARQINLGASSLASGQAFGSYCISAPIIVDKLNTILAGSGANATLRPTFSGPAVIVEPPNVTAPTLSASLATGPGQSITFNGTDGFIDLSSIPQIISGLGSVGYPTYPLGAAQFDLSFFVKQTASCNSCSMIGARARRFDHDTPIHPLEVATNADGSKFNFRVKIGSTEYASGDVGTALIGTTQFIELSYDGSNIRAFVDGSVVWTQAASGPITIPSYTNLSIGAEMDYFPQGVLRLAPIAGSMDSIQFSNIARHTANYTAPTAKATSDANTLLLFNFDHFPATGAAAQNVVGADVDGGTGRAWVTYKTNALEPSGTGGQKVKNVFIDGRFSSGKAGGIEVLAASDVAIEGNKFSSLFWGISLENNSFYSRVSGNAITPYSSGVPQCRFGIGIQMSNAVTLADNELASVNCIAVPTFDSNGTIRNLKAEGGNMNAGLLLGFDQNIYQWDIYDPYIATEGSNPDPGAIGLIATSHGGIINTTGGYLWRTTPSTFPIVTVDGGVKQTFRNTFFLAAGSGTSVIADVKSAPANPILFDAAIKSSAIGYSQSPAAWAASASNYVLTPGNAGSLAGMHQAVSVTGTAQAQSIVLAPAVSEYKDGLTVSWRPSATNTAANPTLNVNSIGDITVVGPTGATLAANDLYISQIAIAVYDAVNNKFFLQNPHTSTIVNGARIPTSAAFLNSNANGQIGTATLPVFAALTNPGDGTWCISWASGVPTFTTSGCPGSGGSAVSSFNTRTGAVTLSFADVMTALTFTPENSSNKGAASGYAPLNSSSQVPAANLPAFAALTNPGNGTWCIDWASSVPTFTNTGCPGSGGSAVSSFNTRTGAITLSSTDVTTALSFTPENAANKGTASGYAPLDGSSKVPVANLPTGTSGTTVAVGNDSRITGALQSTSNLSDLGSAATARTNLGLGTAATQSTSAFDAAGAASAAQAASLQKSSNLSDVANAGTARTNLGVAIGIDVEAHSANLDTYASKTPPSGAMVGTTDAQTLTNKSISGSQINSGTIPVAQIPNPAGDVTGTYAATVVSSIKGATVPVNPLSSGCIANGTADCTAGVQACLAAGTQTCYFPPGTYKYDNSGGVTTITGFQGQIIFDSQAVIAVTTANQPFIKFAATASTPVRVRGLAVSWPSIATTRLGINVEFSGYTDLTIENFRSTWGPGASLWISNGFRDKVYQSTIVGSGTSGNPGVGADGLHFANCTACGAYGIHAYSTGDDALAWTNNNNYAAATGGIASDIWVDGSSANGIRVEGQTGIQLSNVHVKNTAADCIVVDTGVMGAGTAQELNAPADIVVSGIETSYCGTYNTSASAGKYGLHVYGPGTGTVQFLNGSVDHAVSNGFGSDSHSYNVILRNLTLTENGGSCVNAIGNDVTVENVKCARNAGKGVVLDATGKVIYRNVTSDNDNQDTRIGSPHRAFEVAGSGALVSGGASTILDDGGYLEPASLAITAGGTGFSNTAATPVTVTGCTVAPVVTAWTNGSGVLSVIKAESLGRGCGSPLTLTAGGSGTGSTLSAYSSAALSGVDMTVTGGSYTVAPTASVAVTGACFGFQPVIGVGLAGSAITGTWVVPATKCIPGTTFTVTLSGGTGSGGSITAALHGTPTYPVNNIFYENAVSGTGLAPKWTLQTGSPSVTTDSGFKFASPVACTTSNCSAQTLADVTGAAADVTAKSYSTSTGTSVAGGYQWLEGTSPAGVASNDLIYADSTKHRLVENANNTSPVILSGIAAAATAGNCPQFAANGIDLADSGAPCGGAGSSAFSAITTGTNTTATMTVGTGGTITFSGTGLINANFLDGAASPVSAFILGTNGSRQLTATTIAADSLIANATGSTAAPAALAFPTGGTNGCAATTNAITYNTSTHSIGCNTSVGNVTASGMTTGYITKMGGATSLANSAIDDGITTAGVVTSTKPVAAPSFSTTSGPTACGSATGCIALAEGSTAATGAVGADTIRADSTAHALLTKYNTTGSELPLTITIASGTAALGTSAISSAACATAVTVSATGVATTDTITTGFNGDPTAVTGYIPSTSGMLAIIAYPTANNVNFKVCNNTASSITPGAITLNWRVVR